MRSAGFLTSSLLASVLLFGSESARAREPEFCPAILGPFREIVLAAEKPLDQVDLPSKVDLDFRRHDFARAYGMYVGYWKSSFDTGTLRAVIGKISDGKTPTPEDLLWLKTERGKLKKLRNAYVAFGEKHDFTPYLDEMTTRIGHVQDGINSGDVAFTRHESARLENFFTSKVERKLAKEIDGFKPAKERNFRKWFASEVSELRRGLQRKSLSPQEFHRSRKIVSRFVATFDALATLAPSAENLRMTEYLGSLNEQMGIYHDSLVKQALEHEIDYSSDRIAFPVPIRAALDRLVTKLSE